MWQRLPEWEEVWGIKKLCFRCARKTESQNHPTHTIICCPVTWGAASEGTEYYRSHRRLRRDIRYVLPVAGLSPSPTRFHRKMPAYCLRWRLYLFLYLYYNIACDKIIVKRYPVIVTRFCVSWWGTDFLMEKKSWEKWKNPLTRCGDFGIITRTKKQNNALFSPPHQVRMVDTVDGCSMYLAVPIGCAKRYCTFRFFIYY